MKNINFRYHRFYKRIIYLSKEVWIMNNIVLLAVVEIIFLLISSISMNWLMNGTQSGKTFFFLLVILVIVVNLLFRFILSSNTRTIKVSFLDFFLFIGTCYLLLNDYLKSVPVSLGLLDFYGLIFLYVALRQINKKYFILLFFVLLIGGIIQALFGGLQLWGVFPSSNNVFNLTGSFSNPGPYAGYLVGIFPIALGFYLFRINPFPALFGNIIIGRSNLQQPRLFILFQQITRIKKERAKNQSELNLQNNIPGFTFFISSVIFLVLLIILVSRSRAAWIAVIASTCYLLSVKYPVKSILKEYIHGKFKQGIVFFIGILLFVISVFCLYRFKQGSAAGRVLIWKVTSEMISDYLLTGVGTDQFKAYYMDYQANYFKTHPESKEAMVAGDVNYAFNEVLQQTA